MRALYRWHNGTTEDSPQSFVPGHYFPSLQTVLEERRLYTVSIKEANLLPRLVESVLVGHRRSWLDIFPDGGGDGYFFDTKRQGKPGAFLFNFGEDGWFIFFPTLADFLAALLEGYETGVFRARRSGSELHEDFEASESLWLKYGVQGTRS